MRKLILTTSFLVALFLGSNLFAQVHVGVKGSFNLVNMNFKVRDDKLEDFKIKPAFNAGLFAEFSIADEFYLRPELLFSAKGTTYKKTEDIPLVGGEVKDVTKTSLKYIELPVYFLYKGDLGSGNVLVGAGPYFAFGIGGKTKEEITTSGAPIGNGTVTDEWDVKFKGNVEDDDPIDAEYYKPLDIGFSIMAGYEFSSKLSANIFAQLGLTNLVPKYDGTKPDASAKNVGFGLSLGYRIF